MNKSLAAFAVIVTALFATGGCRTTQPAPNTAIMPGSNYMVVVQECKNYDLWQKSYAQDKSNRMTAGLTEISVSQDVDDPNHLILVYKVADVEKAKIFAYSPESKSRTQDSGVIGRPDIYFVRDSR